MQSDMNVNMVYMWTLWSSDAVEYERYDGFGMDALVMNVIMVWVWMLGSSDAVEGVVLVWAWML